MRRLTRSIASSLVSLAVGLAFAAEASAAASGPSMPWDGPLQTIHHRP